MAKAAQAGSEEGRAFEATTGGNEAAFTSQAEPHRQELKIHCYRMVASFEDAEDLVQETFLRAWRARETFQGRSSFRAWLYRIATNACLDFIERSKRRVTASSIHADTGADAIQPPPHIPWLQPFPDPVLDAVAPRDGEPDAVVVTKES